VELLLGLLQNWILVHLPTLFYIIIFLLEITIGDNIQRVLYCLAHRALGELLLGYHVVLVPLQLVAFWPFGGIAMDRVHLYFIANRIDFFIF